MNYLDFPTETFAELPTEVILALTEDLDFKTWETLSSEMKDIFLTVFENMAGDRRTVSILQNVIVGSCNKKKTSESEFIAGCVDYHLGVTKDLESRIYYTYLYCWEAYFKLDSFLFNFVIPPEAWVGTTLVEKAAVRNYYTRISKLENLTQDAFYAGMTLKQLTEPKRCCSGKLSLPIVGISSSSTLALWLKKTPYATVTSLTPGEWGLFNSLLDDHSPDAAFNLVTAL